MHKSIKCFYKKQSFENVIDDVKKKSHSIQAWT